MFPRGFLAILIPSFNDWDALTLLLPRIDRALASIGRRASVLIADDASTEDCPPAWGDVRFDSIDSIEILHLRCNLGHQRAIALGLYHLHEFTEASTVMVMDGDGEDRAEDLPALLQAFEAGDGHEMVFAARARRMESLWFQMFYRLYQVIHRALTGIEVRVGNFSVIPRQALQRLIASPDLWNHYAAAAYQARIPRRTLPLARGARLTGASKMNFVSLLMHALSALSVFSGRISARLLAASAAIVAAAGASIGAGAVSRSTAMWMIAMAVDALMFAVLFAFLIANRRSSAGFILQRDAQYFILGKTTVAEFRPGRIRSI